MPRDVIRIVQITDMHLFSNTEDVLLGVNTYQSFQTVLDLLKLDETQPDLILLSGDLSQDHKKGAYEYIVEAIQSLGIPACYVPGNHDDIEVMNEVLSSSTQIMRLKHLLLDQWQLILLNSQKPKSVEGYLARTELDFLEDCLKQYPSHRAIVVFHHQPMLVGSPWLDSSRLQNADELWSILSRHPNSHTVLFGHVHQEFQSEKNGIPCFSTPSTCIQFKRNSVDFALEKLPPAYRWIDLYQNGELKTGISRAAHYIGFFDAESKGY